MAINQLPDVTAQLTQVADLTVAGTYPILYWSTAIFGGFSAFLGFFGFIYLVFMFTRKPTFWGFVGLGFNAIVYLIISAWWGILTFCDAGKGYSSDATSYSPAYTVFADPAPFYKYWAASAVITVVYIFWQLLTWLYSEKVKK
ncbi:hypothetical protein HT819_003913 [Salmonella enterica]|nr:hypothetical protein [Salmonella enterica]